MVTSSKALAMALWAASVARVSPLALPTAIRAAPPSFMMERTSAKSRLIRPGTVISSEMPWMPWRNTSSATRKASVMEVFFSTISSRRSLGMTIRVSTCSLSFSMPSSAMARRRLPSKAKGLVTTPMVSAPLLLASSAMTGAAPVPVPPPIPQVTKTMSEPDRISRKSSEDSSAAFSPISGSPPAPSPRVNLSPMRTRCGASLISNAWASVLTATKSTPRSPSAIMRLTAFEPPPPTPTTLIWAKCSASMN